MKDQLNESIKITNTITGKGTTSKSIIGGNNIEEKYPVELQLNIRLPEDVMKTLEEHCKYYKTDLVDQLRNTLIRSAAHLRRP